MKKQKTLQILMYVFFVIAIGSLFGIFFQWQKKHTSIVKTVGGSFREGIIGSPRFINPVLAQSQSDKDMTKLVFASLINRNETSHFDLAESLDTSPDHKEYTLTLKKNIYFHDGTKITADDVLFTIEKIQNPFIKSPLFNKWEGVHAEKIDNYKVKFTLDKPYSDFEDNLVMGVLPKHLWEKVKDDEFMFNTLNIKPIGSGYYRVKNIHYKKTGVPQYYTLERVPHSPAYIQEIQIYFYENENELAQAYRDGEIEAAYGLTANQENYDLFKDDRGITGKLPRIFGLFFNQQKQKILKNKNIRLLINEAINRKQIIENVFHGYAYPIDNPLGNIAIEKQKEKEEKIKQYIQSIEKDGWKKDESGIYVNEKTKERLKLEIATPNIEELTHIANLIKEELLPYGINITVRVYEESDLHNKIIRPRNYEILLFGYMIEKNTDLYAFWHSSQENDPGLNISLYTNSTVDRELEQLRKEDNAETLEKISNEINKDVPAAFIYSPAYTYLLPKKIKGEKIHIIEKQDRFSQIKDWYIFTRHVWNSFIKKT